MSVVSNGIDGLRSVNASNPPYIADDFYTWDFWWKLNSMIKFVLLFSSLIIFTGCNSEENFHETTSEYYKYETVGKYAILEVNREMKVAIYNVQNLDIRDPVKIEFCEAEDEYICFRTDFAQLVFAVPKARLSEGFKWSFDGFDFVVVNSKNNYDCGTDHEIISKLNEVYHSRFIYNNKSGLRSFSKYIKDSKSVIGFEPDSTFTSINLGFGHRGGC